MINREAPPRKKKKKTGRVKKNAKLKETLCSHHHARWTCDRIGQWQQRSGDSKKKKEETRDTFYSFLKKISRWDILLTAVGLKKMKQICVVQESPNNTLRFTAVVFPSFTENRFSYNNFFYWGKYVSFVRVAMV